MHKKAIPVIILREVDRERRQVEGATLESFGVNTLLKVCQLQDNNHRKSVKKKDTTNKANVKKLKSAMFEN